MDGVGITAHNYARWLNEKYGKTVLVAPKVKDYEDDEDYRVYRFKSVLLPGMNPYRVGLPLIDITFKKKLKKLHFDIVHGHSPFISGQLAQQLARKRGIPLVATFHTKFRDDFRKVLNNNLFVDFLMNLTLIFIILLTWYGCPINQRAKPFENTDIRANSRLCQTARIWRYPTNQNG